VRPTRTSLFRSVPGLAVLACALLAGGAALAQAPQTRDGTSIERAITLKSDAGSDGAVASEGAWLRGNYPGWRRTRQALMSRNGRRYDRIDLESPAGEKVSVYFDITAAFGLPR
jgi:hypothetical protein